ncbi:MAG: ribonuclease HI family protein [Thermoplasmatales archaeon]|nr:ribonuclease HI family protein [Thermoplasmatales archaeon]
MRFYSDGGSRGNPGPAAFAIVVVDGGCVVHEAAEYIGEATNNVAEYRGLIAALSQALRMGAESPEFLMDSQLVVNQVTGKYRVRSENIRGLHGDAMALFSLLPGATVKHVRREDPMVSRADALLNLELDLSQDRK